MELNIRRARERKGLTGSAVAARLGVPQPTYSAWERGRHPVPISQLVRLTEMLDVSADYLLGLIPEELEEEGRMARVIGRSLNSKGLIELSRYRNMLLQTGCYSEPRENE